VTFPEMAFSIYSPDLACAGPTVCWVPCAGLFFLVWVCILVHFICYVLSYFFHLSLSLYY
jgi:hypothetical protein